MTTKKKKPARKTARPTAKKKAAPPPDPCRVCALEDNYTCFNCDPEKNRTDQVRLADEADTKIWKFETAWKQLEKFVDESPLLGSWPEGFHNLFYLLNDVVGD